jgi:Ca2+-binding EF-hand superfamily protein
MKWIKLFEDFKQNNEEGNLLSQEGNPLSQEDIIKCIKKGGIIYATIVQEMPENDPKEALKAIDIDKDGLITVEQDKKIGYVKLENVEKIEI